MVYVVYHSHCFDGFGAALSAWLHFGDKHEGMEVQYLPTTYGKPLPLDLDSLTKEDQLYVLDFCFDRASILKAEEKAGIVKVLDHHISHQKSLEGLERLSVFNMSKSGAMLAWEYFHPKSEIPKLITYIQDRDIWLHQIPDSEHLYCGLNTVPMTFEVWKEFLLEDNFQKLLQEGAVAYKTKRKEVLEAMKKAFPCKFDGIEVLAVNSSSLHISDILNGLLVENPEVPFTVGFYFEKDFVKFSLRSRGGVFTEGVLNFDTASLCEKYGGGGHRNASGIRLPLGNTLLPLPLERFDK